MSSDSQALTGENYNTAETTAEIEKNTQENLMRLSKAKLNYFASTTFQNQKTDDQQSERNSLIKLPSIKSGTKGKEEYSFTSETQDAFESTAKSHRSNIFRETKDN